MMYSFSVHHRYFQLLGLKMDKEFYNKIVAIAKTDVYHIISKHVELSPRGKDYNGKCPFCVSNDDFTISTPYGLFYCFSCQQGGDPIKFLSLLSGENVEQVAIRLAKDYELL